MFLDAIKFDRMKKCNFELLLKIFLAVFAISWFHFLKNGVVAMDDIDFINYFNDPNIRFVDKTFLNVVANRFRPVFNIVQYIVYFFCENNYQLWFYFNVSVNIVISIVFFNIIKKITKSLFITFIVSVVYLTSRCSYYNITQMNGILEALCILLVLFVLNNVINYWRSRKAEFPLALIIGYLLVVFTHERYIIIVGFLILFFFLCDFISLLQKISFSLICALIPFLNIFVKKCVLKIPFLVGTGSTTELGFHVKSFIGHCIYSTMNVVGINIGPRYLNGLYFDAIPAQMKIVSLSVAFISLAIIVFYIYCFIIVNSERNSRIIEFKKTFLALSAIGLLIISFSVTRRVELRWIYMPFIIYLVCVAYCSGLIKEKCFKENFVLKRIMFFVLFIFMILSIGIDWQYRKHVDSIFFMEHQMRVSNILKQTSAHYGSSLKNYDIYVIDPSPCVDWLTALNSILKANSNISDLKVITILSKNEIPRNHDKILVFDSVDNFKQILLK